MRRIPPHRPRSPCAAAAARGRRAAPRRPPPTVGDRQRLRHAGAPERDRHPRLDARARRADRACTCASASSTGARRPLAAASSQAARRLGLEAGRGRAEAARTSRAGTSASSRPPRAARTSCAASCSSGGGAATRSSRTSGDDERAPRPPAPTRATSAPPCARSPRRDAEQPRVVGDDARHAHRLEPPDRRGVVDRPDVELAARRAQRAHSAGVTSRQWAISASARPARTCRRRAREPLPRAAASRPYGGEQRELGGGVVAPHPRDRPAEPQPRLERAQHDEVRVQGRDQRPLDQAVRAQGVHDAPLVAGQLQVDVELDAREARTGEVGEALLERGRAPACV